MTDFSTVGILILLVTQAFSIIDIILNRVEKSSCGCIEMEFKKDTPTTTTHNITNNYYESHESEDE